MKIAIFPGTFDPVTWGHLDIIIRAAAMFDKLIIAVAQSHEKVPLFDINERVEMIQVVLREALPVSQNYEVTGFDGLLVQHALDMQASIIIRGLRSVSDFDYELQMAGMNQRLAPHIETVFLMAHERYHFLSSTLIKSVAKCYGQTVDFVPPYVAENLRRKFDPSLKEGAV